MPDDSVHSKLIGSNFTVPTSSLMINDQQAQKWDHFKQFNFLVGFLIMLLEYKKLVSFHKISNLLIQSPDYCHFKIPQFSRIILRLITSSHSSQVNFILIKILFVSVASSFLSVVALIIGITCDTRKLVVVWWRIYFKSLKASNWLSNITSDYSILAAWLSICRRTSS